MKKFLILPALFFCNFVVHSQTPKDYAVELSASVQSNPPAVKISWLASSTTTNYSVARKPKNATLWTVLAANLPGSSTQYFDNTISAATHYEYRVIRNGVGYTGYGYINTGLQIPAVDDRGKLILLIADTHSLSLASEIKRLQDDIEGDGWTVLTSYISPTLAVTQVKAQIVATYNLDPLNTKALFLLGHVPVPYSGNLAPDGHTNHQGAWPADVYYGELNGSWTDVTASSPTGQGVPSRNQNVPGDGKFDQSYLPSAMELQVGRVDLSGMSTFTSTETQLLKKYLDKDHDYRKKIISVAGAGIIDDNFGLSTGEAFAANGYKNFAPLITATNVISGDYFTSMTGGAGYQWSYGCGGGSPTSASGIGQTSDFASANLQGIFTMLFGSYFGDWDTPDNFLRAPLCQGKTLTSVWAGRPDWMFHHMGMGENIGYSAMVTQNNINTYYYNYGNTFVHTALMGDPTLRNNVIAPVSNVVATKTGYNCSLTWSASPDPNVIGYNVYMKNDSNQTYLNLTSVPNQGTSLLHVCAGDGGVYKYMVRAVKLETTPSGTYFNMSEGVSDTALFLPAPVVAAFTNTLAGVNLGVTSTSSNSSLYFWDFGNGTTSTLSAASASYTANGTYTVMLIASNICYDADTSYLVVDIQGVGFQELSSLQSISIVPNPSTGKLKIDFAASVAAELNVFSVDGKRVFEKKDLRAGDEINLSGLNKGIYLLQLQDGNRCERKKLVLE